MYRAALSDHHTLHISLHPARNTTYVHYNFVVAKPLVNHNSTLINSLWILPMIDGRKVLKIHEICNFQHYLKLILPIKITYTYFHLLPTKINESNVFVIIRCYILTIYELLSRNRSKVEIYSKHICTSNAIHMSKQIDDLVNPLPIFWF